MTNCGFGLPPTALADMDLAQPLPSDDQLVDATRRGSDAAWAELDARHGSAVVAIAKAHRTRGPRRAAQQAMNRLRAAIADEPPVPDGEPAVRAMRPRAIAALTDGTYEPDDDADESDQEMLAEAFARLPEAWQAVLWHGVVEQRSAAEMTPLLGRGVNDVIALEHVARSGLHQTYLRTVADSDDTSVAEECRDIIALLGAAERGTLAAVDQRRVDRHLADGRDGEPCRDCRARLDVLTTLDDRLADAIVPGIARLSADRYRTLVGTGERAFGSAALFAARSDRVRRLAVVWAAVAIVVAVVGALVLVQRPFASVDGGPIASRVADTTVPTVDGTDPPTDTTTPAATTVAPTTTELLLRPPPTGPANVIELAFAPGTRAQGAVAPQPELAVDLSSPAPVFAGGTGTVDVAITNRAGTATLANFEIRTPNGLLFDSLRAGDADCRGASDVAAFCNVALDPGASATLALQFSLESDVVGRLVVESELASEPLEVAIVATSRLVHSSVGRGDVVMIGNTLMSCADDAPACASARALEGDVVNRWDVPMQHVGARSDLGWANSSSATLELPDGSEVDAAYLFWSGDLSERGQQVPDDGSREQAVLTTPAGGAPLVVDAQRLFLGDVDATQYLGYADVTSAVAAGGSGDYVVADVQSVEVQGSYAGWSLVVVTADPAVPRRLQIVTSPFAWFAPGLDYASSVPVPFGSAAASLAVLAFEGEPGFVDGRFEVGGVAIGDGNEFDSSIEGTRDPAFVNNFGIDIETYDLRIDAPDGLLEFDATSDKDGVRLAVYGLAVDVAS